MKKMSYAVTLVTIAAAFFIASAVAAPTQQDKDRMSPGKMDMSAMMSEPHHQLAMAYKENMVNFAKALQQATAGTGVVNVPFARAAVAEMRRSFDLMQQHHMDHMKAMDGKMKDMDDKMKSDMAGMKKDMEAHEMAIKDDLIALEKEVQSVAPDSGKISSYVGDLLTNSDAKCKMCADMMEHKMADPKDHNMN